MADPLDKIRKLELALGGVTGLEDAMPYEALEELLKEQIPVPRRKPESLEEILDAWREDDEQKLFEQLTRAQDIQHQRGEAGVPPFTDDVIRVVVGDSDMATQQPPYSSLTQRDVAPRKIPEWAQRNVAAQIAQEQVDSEAQLETAYQLGASDSDLRNEPYGALTDLDRAQKIIGDLYPAAAAPRDKWGMALEFFLKMAAASGTPGPSGRYPTALGAAGQSGADIMALERERVKDERAEQIAKGTATATLLTAIGKPGTLKAGYTAGPFAMYMSAEDAAEYTKNQGLSPDSPNFKRAVADITAPDPSLIGKPVSRGGFNMQIIPVVEGDEIINFNLVAIPSARTLGHESASKRLAALAKDESFFENAATTVPTVKKALDVLFDNPDATGALQAFTFKMRRMVNSAFGTTDPNIMDMQLLESVANILGPKMRPEGSGSTSDIEFAAYKAAILDMGGTALANYINLYTYLKSIELGSKFRVLETNILEGGGTRSNVMAAINRVDTGYYEKYDREKFGDPTKQENVDAWVASLDNGAVIYNVDKETGDKLFETAGTFLVKGWKGK